MSYESYRGQQQGGYSQNQAYDPPSGYSGYGGNPYEQQGPGHNQQGRNNYNAPQQGGGYEMNNMNGAGDPNRILNECRAVDRSVDEIEEQLQRLTSLRNQNLNSSDGSRELRQEIDRQSDDIMVKYRGLVTRVKNIRQSRESGDPRNAPQVGKVDRRVKTSLNHAQQLDRDYRKRSEEQIVRQYRTVRPDASDAEVREVLESQDQQIFSQALMNSDRRGEAQSTLRRVQGRHEDIQRIERQMMELAQLFTDLDTLVVQQEPAVTQIEERGEEVKTHVKKADTELGGAVVKARAARKKKWICLGIGVAIVVVVVIIVVVVVKVT